MTTLYHFTCDHGRAALGGRGDALPLRMHSQGRVDLLPVEHRWMADLVWFTDLGTPTRTALGLTSHTLPCDRLAYRYRALDTARVERWLDVCAAVAPRADYVNLHRSPGVLPGTWWVAWEAVSVELD